MSALAESFFARSVHRVARDLVGCELLADGVGGVIVETEAYEAADPACHAYVGPTARNQVLFGPPSRAYVYLSYGIHTMLNVVAKPDGQTGAVLIRAIAPDAQRKLRSIPLPRGGRDGAHGEERASDRRGITLRGIDAGCRRVPV